MKKHFFTFVIIMTFVFLLHSCNTKTNSVETTPTNSDNTVEDNSVTESTELSDEIPNLNFEGYEFKILNVDQTNLWYMNVLMEAEEITGEAINDAAYRRSVEIKERFNCEIKEIKITSAETHTYFRTDVMSGARAYDFAMVGDKEAFTLASEGMIYDINDLPYINLDKPWWDQNAKTEFSVGGKVFFLPGAYELTNYDMTRIILMSKTLMQNLNITEDIYELVKSGEWTHDVMYSMAKIASADLDGNGLYDYNDQYGISATATHHLFGAVFHSSGESFVKKDNDDLPYFAADNERLYNVFTSMIDNLYSGNITFNAKNVSQATDWCTNMFNDNRVLFYVTSFNRVSAFRNMEADFGILPMPKFDSEQDRYYCEAGGARVGVVPINLEDPVRTSAIWEAYCFNSYKYVVHEYKEVGLKVKNTRDNESSEMIDIIFDSRSYDLGRCYWGSTIMDKYISLFESKGTGVASLTQSIESAAEKVIEDAIKLFTED